MISDERAKQTFSGNGSSKKFPIPFDFFKNTAGVFDKNNQISVILTDAAGTETTLTEDTDYEVEIHNTGLTEDTDGETKLDDTGNSGSAGYSGYVVLNTAPAVGEKLTIMRDVPLVQELNLAAGQEIPAVALEAALDKIVMTQQQLNEKLQRAICYPVSAEEKPSAEGFLEQLNELKDTAQKAQAEAQKALSQASDLKDETLQIARCARNIAGADEDVPVDIAILLDEIKETQEN